MDKVKKVVKKAEKKGWTWEKTMKVLAPIISWLTKGKIEKNTVLAILGIAGSVFVGNQKADKADLEVMKPTIDHVEWFFGLEEIPDSTVYVQKNTAVLKD
jgi:hypothetical protein